MWYDYVNNLMLLGIGLVSNFFMVFCNKLLVLVMLFVNE